MPGTLLTMSRTVVVPMPWSVAAMARTVAVVPMPGSVVAVARTVVVGRTEDEGVRRKTVPISVPARMATGMRPSVVKAMPPLFVRYPEKGSRGNSVENRLAGRNVMAERAAATLSLTGERRLDAESKHCEQGPEQGR